MKTTPEPSQPIRHSHGLVATGVLAASIAAAVIATAPAGATVDANPNAIRFGPVSCPAIGRTFDEVWLPTINSKAAHVLGGVVGVAKSLYFTDATGNSAHPSLRPARHRPQCLHRVVLLAIRRESDGLRRRRHPVQGRRALVSTRGRALRPRLPFKAVDQTTSSTC